jgi:hypothetical protein
MLGVKIREVKMNVVVEIRRLQKITRVSTRVPST